jgi:hypothetical protein
MSLHTSHPHLIPASTTIQSDEDRGSLERLLRHHDQSMWLSAAPPRVTRRTIAVSMCSNTTSTSCTRTTAAGLRCGGNTYSDGRLLRTRSQLIDPVCILRPTKSHKCTGSNSRNSKDRSLNTRTLRLYHRSVKLQPHIYTPMPL